MTAPPDIMVFADEAAARLDLKLSAEGRKAVIANLSLLFSMAATVEQALDKAPAPEFRL